MINASKEFIKKLKNGGNNALVNYADFTLSDGTVLHLTYKDFMIGGCQIEDKTTDGKFGVGYAIGKTITIRIANHDEKFSDYDFYKAIVNVYVAMKLDNGTIEKIRKGVFYVTVPSTAGEIIEIKGVDAMYRLDKDYSESSLKYPATLQAVITNVCLDCGIPIGFTHFDNMGYVVKERPEKATYRQILSYACQISGYNALCDKDGYLQLIWYNTELLNFYNINGGSFKKYPHNTVYYGGNFKNYGTGTAITGGNFTDPRPEHIYQIKSLNVHTDDVKITGVRVTGEDKATALSGESGYVVEINGNPFADGREQEVADYLGSRMNGMMFRPFSASIVGNPLYEPFDIVMVSDAKGRVYVSLLNSVSYAVGGYTQISCQAEDPVRNGSEYVSPAASAVVESRRNTQNQIAEYDKAVQIMNQIAMNAMGFYTTYEEQEDGSRIVYLHDKPALSESQTIYKQTIDGFFVSQDGGKSYTAGFDKNGNAVVNILSAVGILFDWAKGGTLTLGGVGNGNGRMTIQNAFGKQIGYIDNTGVHFTSGSISLGELFKVDSNGKLTANDLISSNAHITGGSINISSETDGSGFIKLRYPSYHWYIEITPRGIEVLDESSGHNVHIRSDMIYFYKNSEGTDIAGYIDYNDNKLSIKADRIIANDELISLGTKTRAVETEDFGTIMQYCYEMSSPMFGDIGRGELDKNGLCYIYFDIIFLQTVVSRSEYYVFLQKEGKGDLWIKEKQEKYFLVEGTPGLEFSWEVKVKQKDYEYEHLGILRNNEFKDME